MKGKVFQGFFSNHKREIQAVKPSCDKNYEINTHTDDKDLRRYNFNCRYLSLTKE